MAMVMGLIPVVGVPLPLISYGGTAMLTVMFGFGLLMSVYVHRDTRIGRLGERALIGRRRRRPLLDKPAPCYRPRLPGRVHSSVGRAADS